MAIIEMAILKKKRENHKKDETVKIQKFTLVMILWFFLKNYNLGLKM